VRESFPIFDELSDRGEAWNVYQYMLKLSSGAVGKIVLGKDFKHFNSVDAPLHTLPLAIAESLVINKRIASRGEWYSHLPFGDPKRLKELQGVIGSEMMESIKNAKASGTEDLPLQDAALKSADIIGMASIRLKVLWHSANMVGRLSGSRNRLKRPEAPGRTPNPSSRRRGRCWIHDHVLTVVVAYLRPGSIR